MLPKDPNLLFSLVNTKLRDQYGSLEMLCEDMDVSKDEILSVLKGAGYEYVEGDPGRFV